LRTPRISTCMGSGLLPVKTVHAVPVSPAWTSLSGKKPPPVGGPATGGGVCAEMRAGERAIAKHNASAASRRQVFFKGVSTTIRVQPVGWLCAARRIFGRLRGFAGTCRKKRLVRLRRKVRNRSNVLPELIFLLLMFVLLVVRCKPWNRFSQPSAAKARW